MKRIVFLQEQERKRLSAKKLRAEYASLYRSLSLKNKDFKRLVKIKKTMKGGDM